MDIALENPCPEQRCQRDASDLGSQVATDLQVLFQRGEADLVPNLGKHLQRFIQAAGFAVRSIGSQHDWPPASGCCRPPTPGHQRISNSYPPPSCMSGQAPCYDDLSTLSEAKAL